MSTLNSQLREKMISEISEVFPNVDPFVIRELCSELRTFEDVVDRILEGGENLAFKPTRGKGKKAQAWKKPVQSPSTDRDRSKHRQKSSRNTELSSSNKQTEVPMIEKPSVRGQTKQADVWPALKGSNKKQKTEKFVRSHVEAVDTIQTRARSTEEEESSAQTPEIPQPPKGFEVVFPSFLQDVIVEYDLFFRDSEEEKIEEPVIEEAHPQATNFVHTPYYPGYIYQADPYAYQNASFPQMNVVEHPNLYGMYGGMGYNMQQGHNE